MYAHKHNERTLVNLEPQRREAVGAVTTAGDSPQNAFRPSDQLSHAAPKTDCTAAANRSRAASYPSCSCACFNICRGDAPPAAACSCCRM